MAYRIANGYFTTVNGTPVVAKPVSMPHTDWQAPGGKSYGVVFHYTVGCNDDISGTLGSNSSGGATFNVGKTGTIYQYAPLNVATFHCYHESHFYYGIEHTAYPGNGCELNDRQLWVSAALSAALVEYMKSQGTTVPFTHWPNSRSNDYKAGFHDHRDFDGDGDNSHTDHLYNWTWAKYLDAVKSFSAAPKPPAPTPAPEPTPTPGDDMSDYADGVADYLDHPDRPLPLPDKWSAEKVKGYKFSRQLVAKAVAEAKKP
jgi:hypothetical protein